jgi:Flp pilus assembly protein TadD
VPLEVRARYDGALGLMRAGQYVEAEASLKTLVQEQPNLVGPYLNLAIVYMRMDRKAEAEEALRGALNHRPDNAVAYNLLGVAYREQGRFVEARTAYEQALKIDPAMLDVYLNLGILFDLYLQDAARALEYYEHYQELAGERDKQVDLWITDLRQRAPTETAPARGGNS